MLYVCKCVMLIFFDGNMFWQSHIHVLYIFVHIGFRRQGIYDI